MDPQEQEWIARAQQGDLPAFEQLVLRHDHYVLRLIERMVAHAAVDDLYQETFIRAFTSLASFRGESSFRTWLTRIAIRECLNHRRRQRRWRWLPLPEQATLAGLVSREAAPDGQALRQELWDHLAAALETLPDSQRTAFVLKYMQGCKISEIALLLGKAEGTIKSDLFRAMQRIKPQMRHIYDDSEAGR